MSLVEIFAVVGRIGIVEDLLAAGAAHPSGYQAPVRYEVDFRQFLGQPHRIFDRRQRIAEQHNADLLGDTRQDRRFDVHHAPHAEGGAVMLVEHHRVEAKLFGIDRFVEILVVQARAHFAVEKAVRSSRRSCGF